MDFKDIETFFSTNVQEEVYELLYSDNSLKKVYKYTNKEDVIKFLKDIDILHCEISEFQELEQAILYRVICKKDSVLFSLSVWRPVDDSEYPYILQTTPARAITIKTDTYQVFE